MTLCKSHTDFEEIVNSEPFFENQGNWSVGFEQARSPKIGGVKVGPGSQNPNLFAQPVPVSSKSTYKISTCAASAGETNGTGKLQVNWLDKKGQYMKTESRTFQLDETLQTYEFAVSAPAGARTAMLYVVPEGEVSVVNYQHMVMTLEAKAVPYEYILLVLIIMIVGLSRLLRQTLVWRRETGANTTTITPRFLVIFVTCAIAFGSLLVGLSLAINPYGISPLNAAVTNINHFKPKRLDIDRIIKPIEVLFKQPDTIIMGTSRIHQSMNPRVLDIADYGVSYNAAVPANNLRQNLEYIKLYKQINPSFKRVIVELFDYNFYGTPQTYTKLHEWSIYANIRNLTFSFDAIWDSVLTIAYNQKHSKRTFEIDVDGFLIYPEGHNPQHQFSGFPDGIWDLHQKNPEGLLDDAAFESVRGIKQFADKNGIELVFIITPQHAYYDYYLSISDRWHIQHKWLERLYEITPVYNFAYPNIMTHEPVSPNMRYWNDPFHFSENLGSEMLLELQKFIRGELTNDNIIMAVTEENIPQIIANRKKMAERWAAKNPKFVDQMIKRRDELGIVIGEIKN